MFQYIILTQKVETTHDRYKAALHLHFGRRITIRCITKPKLP